LLKDYNGYKTTDWYWVYVNFGLFFVALMIAGPQSTMQSSFMWIKYK